MLARLDSFVRRYGGDEARGDDEAPTAGPAQRAPQAAVPSPATATHVYWGGKENAQQEAQCGGLADSEEEAQRRAGNPHPAHPSRRVADHDASCFDQPVDDLDPEHRMWRSEGRLPRLAYDVRYPGRTPSGSPSLSLSSTRSISTESLVSKASTCSSAPAEYGGDDNSFYRMLDVGVFA